ncbi:dehydrogenase [Frondihabitans sp. PAMC 28766]|uniref:SDR family NAD(P)-dependent oxidoreductase n=1 Tax=Frondihabitans sp. PAMC 28766 TaxID=1795630 RepID=UPI00078E2322|nr:SDR family oxidoreductase [Frondihabitans sp. PAMC 28766]AMM21947.1 dehydrogenase [Frondihabitans sp. PAMC 28766]
MTALEGRTAVVTGAGRGIGAAVARRLAADGAAVVVNYRSSASAADEVAGSIRDVGGRAITVQGDVGEEGVSEALVAAAVAEFGGLDVFVSNAGIEHFGALPTITKQQVDDVFSINVTAQLLAAQAAAAVMGEGGSIILMSSVSRRMSVFEHSVYAASKAAIQAMVRNLAPELGARGIRINAIAPGGTNTDMAAEVASLYTHPLLRDLPQEVQLRVPTALQRFAEPTEIAAAIAFLAGPDASYVTGSTMEVDGGMS